MKATIPLFQEIRALRRSFASTRSESIFDYRTYGDLIQYCADHKLFFSGRLLHGRIIISSIIPENFLGSKLISFYSKCGQIDEARNVFDEISPKSVFSFNAMLIAYSVHRKPFQALGIFSHLLASDVELKVDAYSISSILKCLSLISSSSSLSVTVGKEIHGFVLRSGIVSDIFVMNGLVTLYAKFGSMDLARKMFELMHDKDVISWNAMISGYDQGGYYEECLELYAKLESSVGDNLKPDGVTVVSVLHACSQVKDFDFGVRVHRSLEIYGAKIDMAVRNSLIAFYARCGKLEFARELFNEVLNKDNVTYGAMISGYMCHGFIEQAMEIFREIQNPVLTNWNAVISGLAQNNRHMEVLQIFRDLENSGLRPNSVTLSSILPSISFFSNLQTGKQIHGYAIKNNIDQNIYVVSSLIDMYAKAGILHGACRIFHQHSSSKSAIVWTAIISAYASHGDADAALSLFRAMISGGIKPDHVTFTAILSACAHAGEVDEARLIFESMMQNYGIVPWMEQYACMVGVLSRAGIIDEALTLIREMPEKPNAKVWGALLNGASLHGDVSLGEYAFKFLMDIEPDNTGNYVVMANLYVQKGKIEKAEMMREKMRKMGLGKIPGCSWVETPDGIHTFVAQDTSRTRSDELCVMLDCLSELIREHRHGYGDDVVDNVCD